MRRNRTDRRVGNLVAREIGIGVDNTFVRVRHGGNCNKEIAEKVAKYYGQTLLGAFEQKIDVKPLSADYVSKITYTLSALFTACVKNGVLTQNPVVNATKKTHPHILTISIFPYSLKHLRN